VDASGNVSVNDNSHQHTVSNITNMPTSLPANGGNADTVDNKHASDFALLTHNHTGIYEPVLNANQKVKITSGTAAPSGGVSGDVYLQYV
jgi:hypothetical protein